MPKEGGGKKRTGSEGPEKEKKIVGGKGLLRCGEN